MARLWLMGAFAPLTIWLASIGWAVGDLYAVARFYLLGAFMGDLHMLARFYLAARWALDVWLASAAWFDRLLRYGSLPNLVATGDA
jgi:hypothetical protein